MPAVQSASDFNTSIGLTVKLLKTLSYVSEYTQRYLKSKVLVSYLKTTENTGNTRAV